ncbi:MAG: patatin-like phospholipase family protein [Planctomycetota bacterium]|jgi:NTE family protein
MIIPEKAIGLSLSGGGYRATLFAIGSLWRLNEFGLLKHLGCITSVSGGSITSGYLAMHWSDLIFDQNDVATNFEKVIAEPLESFCSKPLDIYAVGWGLLSFETIGDKVAKIYSKRLFKGTTLNDLPSGSDCPVFIFYGTSLQTGSSVRFSQDYISDYKIGRLTDPKMSLAKVVGASSAFPPVLSPVSLETNPEKWEKQKYSYLYDEKNLRKKMFLTDGGVYDNLGIEAIWKGGFKTVLVCDAGAPLKVKDDPRGNWLSQALRANSIITEQTRSLRKRSLISNFMSGTKYGGTYWGISTEINDYELEDSMVKDNDITGKLKDIRTRLNVFSKKEQGRLINWGYALTDTALRKWVYKDNSQQPGKWPRSKYLLTE